MDFETENNLQEEQTASPDKKKDKSFFWDVFGSCLILIAVLFVINIFVKPCFVYGESMSPTLEDDEYLFISNIAYTPSEGDVVVFHNDAKNLFLIKRIIATGNKWIRIDYDSQMVYVSSDDVFEESDVIDETSYVFLDTGFYSSTGVFETFVPEGFVFVMGDNRNNSLDSRSETIGLVDTDEILGRVLLRIFPIWRFGTIN